MLWTVVLEKKLESPLDCKEIQPVYPKGDQSWVFIGRTDVEAETPILWPPDAKSWRIWKDPDAGKDWRQEKKGTNDRGWDGWMASLTQWTWVWVNSGVGDGQGGLECYSPKGCRVGHNWATELKPDVQERATTFLVYLTNQSLKILYSLKLCSHVFSKHFFFTFFVPFVLHPLTIEMELAHPILFHSYTQPPKAFSMYAVFQN